MQPYLGGWLKPDESTVRRTSIYQLVRPEAWADLVNLEPKKYIKPVPGLQAPLYMIPGGFKVEDLDIEIVESILSERDRSKHEFFLFCRQLLRSFDDFDYILIDCPPNKMYLTKGMMRACSHFLTVTIPDRISIFGIPRLLARQNTRQNS